MVLYVKGGKYQSRPISFIYLRYRIKSYNGKNEKSSREVGDKRTVCVPQEF